MHITVLAFTSPFQTADEFLQAEGPIYGFANQPGMIAFLIIIAALISLYFVYASYTVKGGDSGVGVKRPTSLGVLILAGAMSLFGTLSAHSVDRGERRTVDAPRSARSVQMAQRDSDIGPFKAMGLLGLVGSVASGRRVADWRRSRNRRGSAAGRRKIR